ncbi:MAG: S41 family peptidase [Mycobacterium leprae]
MRFSKRRTVIVSLITAIVILGASFGVARADDRTDGLFQKLRLVYDVVEQWHKDGADPDKFVNGAIKGGLEALGDPYTNYFTADEYADFIGALNGSFTGIGAYLDQDGTYVVIVAPIKGSPAEKAGLKPGDRILEVDGQSLAGASTEKAGKLIKGPADTQVTLKIERPSEQRTFTVTITRALIELPEVDSNMLNKQVGYIQIASFGDNATADFYKAVASLKGQGAKALVLDLRGNGGGYLDDAVAIASGFVPDGKPVVWEVAKGEKDVLNANGDYPRVNLPVVILVDKGTASASEILSGALQDYGIAKLVGTTTFGKGTVQQLLSLSDGSAMKVTIAEYLTAKERHVHGIGLTPDVKVEQPEPDQTRIAPMKIDRFLTVSSVGVDVLYLQERLQDLGYSPDTTGFFGVKTRDAVIQFGIDNWLPQGKDPVVDQEFIDALNKKVTEHLRQVKPVDVQLNKAIELVTGEIK